MLANRFEAIGSLKIDVGRDAQRLWFDVDHVERVAMPLATSTSARSRSATLNDDDPPELAFDSGVQVQRIGNVTSMKVAA